MLSNTVEKWKNFTPEFQSLLRIVSAFTFMLAGTTKLFAFPVPAMPDGSTVELFSQIGFGAVLETFGGALLLAGFWTRPVAFILSGEMAVAYFQFHQPNALLPNLNGGMAAFLFCFIWLYFSAAGAGKWSIDFMLKK